MKSLIKNKTLKSSISLILVLCLCFFSNIVEAKEKLTEKDILDLKEEAFALYSTNNKEEALRLLDEIPQNYRNDDIFVIAGNIFEDMNENSVAIENFNKAINTNPKSYKAYYNIGCILLKKKSYKLAEENFKLSIKHNGDFAYGHYNLASCYIAQNDYKKAKRHLIKAINLKPDDENFYINLAYCYKMLDNKKAAQKILDSLNKVKS